MSEPLLGRGDAGSGGNEEGEGTTSFSESFKRRDPTLVTIESAGVFFFFDGILYPSKSADALVQRKGTMFCGTSLGMTPDEPLREFAIKVVCNKRVQNFILFVIIANCVFMLFEPPVVVEGSAAEFRSQLVEWPTMVLFTIELISKVTAHGLVCVEVGSSFCTTPDECASEQHPPNRVRCARGQGGYLHNPWNLLDLVVVLPFWILLAFPNAPSFASLQIARALRPLRTLRSFPELQRVVASFLAAAPALSSVMAFTVFFFLVSGTVGVELLQGSLHHRCAIAADEGELDVDLAALASSAASVSAAALPQVGRALKGSALPLEYFDYCNTGPSACGNLTCFDFRSNPPGVTSTSNFDNIRGASLVLLQVRQPWIRDRPAHPVRSPAWPRGPHGFSIMPQAMTFEGWSDLMFQYARAEPGMETFVFVFFSLVTILGGFVLMNMFVAVIFDQVMRSVDFRSLMEAVDQAVEVRLQAQLGKRRAKPCATPVLSQAALQDASQEDVQQPPPSSSGAGDGTLTHSPSTGALSSTSSNGSPDPESGGAPDGDCCGFEGFLKPLGYLTAFAIAANIVIMCLAYRGMSAEYEAFLNQLASGFTFYFLGECLAKLLSYGRGNLLAGWQQYWTLREDSTWNRLDFTVLTVDVGSQAVELAIDLLGGGDDTSNPTYVRVLRVFRAVRVLRAFKLSHVWEPLHVMLQMLFRAATPVLSLAVLILMFSLMFALLGKELLGGVGLDKISRMHFDKPLPALLTVMVVFSGEDWPSLISSASTVVPSVTATVYTGAVLLLGYFVVRFAWTSDGAPSPCAGGAVHQLTPPRPCPPPDCQPFHRCARGDVRT